MTGAGLHTKGWCRDGILMAASSDGQARRAAEPIGNCRLVELKSSHLIHWYHPQAFLDAGNVFLPA